MKKYKSWILGILIVALTGVSYGADQRIAYTEEMVGSGHPTKSDTLNRLGQVEHNTDGTHKMTSGTAGKMYYHDGTKLTAFGPGATTEILVGGGAAVPVFTTATGTGAPVRAGSPTFTTQITAPLVYGSSADNGDITIEGTSSATKTTSYVILQPTTGNVGIGTKAPTSKLQVHGTDSSATNAAIIQMTTSADIYPLMSMHTYTHDNMSIYFDGYWNGSRVSSDAGSNYAIGKNADLLKFEYASGVAVGSGVTYTAGMVMNTSGNVGIGTIVPIETDHINGTLGVGSITDASNYEYLKTAQSAGLLTLSAQTLGTGTDNVGFRFTPAGTGGHQFTDGVVTMSEYGAGAATFDANGVISSVSDERMKNVKGPFTAGLAEILGINPVLFKYNSQSGLDQENTYAGLLAQNVLAYIPQAVGKNPDGFYSLQDRPLIAALINAIKTLQAEVEVLGGVKVNAATPQVGEAGIVASKPFVRMGWTEIDKLAALTTEEYDEKVMKDNQPIIDSYQTKYTLSGDKVTGVQVPVYQTVKKTRAILRNNVKFDGNTGKFYEKLPQ